jgi:cysteinyl-tRNA synthetase
MGGLTAVSSQQSSVVSQQNFGIWNLKSGIVSPTVFAFVKACYEAMNDDFNSPVLIAELFNALRIINQVKEGKEKMPDDDKALLGETYRTFIEDILGWFGKSSQKKR